MSQVMIYSIGTRAADNVTVNSVGTSGDDFNLTLSASVPTTTAIGDKFTDSGGNSYRVVGKSGSTLTVRKYFGTTHTGQPSPVTGAGTTTRAYSSHIAWEAAKPADLTSVATEGDTGIIWKGELWYDGDAMIDVSAAMTISGSTASPTCFTWLTAAPGEDWITKRGSGAVNKDTPGAGFDCPSGVSSITMITVAESYALVEKIRISITLTSRTVGAFWQYGLNSCVRHCLVATQNSTAYTGGGIVRVGRSSESGQEFKNNIVIVAGASTGQYALEVNAGNSGGTQTCHAYANTFVRPTGTGGGCTAIRRNGAGRHRIIGNAFFGFDALFSTATGGTLYENSNNATDLAAGGTPGTDELAGSNNLHGQTYSSQFENVTAGAADFRTKSGAALIGASIQVTTPTDPRSAVTNGPTLRNGTGDVDAALQSRSSSAPTIGGWEVVGADSTAPAVTDNGDLAVQMRTTSSVVWEWNPAKFTDATGVTGYEVSEDSGPAIDVGNVVEYTKSGMSQGETISLRVRAYDAAGNRSAYTTGVDGTSKKKVVSGVVLKSGSSPQADLTGLWGVILQGTPGSVSIVGQFSGKTTNGSGVLENVDCASATGSAGADVALLVSNSGIDPTETGKRATFIAADVSEV